MILFPTLCAQQYICTWQCLFSPFPINIPAVDTVRSLPSIIATYTQNRDYSTSTSEIITHDLKNVAWIELKGDQGEAIKWMRKIDKQL